MDDDRSHCFKPIPLAAMLQDALPGNLKDVLFLRKEWQLLVGPRIAEHTTPLRLTRQGVLWIAVDHPAWNGHLEFLRHDLLAKLQRCHPVFGITGLRSTVKPLADLPTLPQRQHFEPEETYKATPTGLPREVVQRVERTVAPLLERDRELGLTVRRMMLRQHKRRLGLSET